MSPTSPRSANGLDYTSYHEQAKSPEAMSEAGAMEEDVSLGGEDEQDGGGDEAEEVDDLRDMQEIEDPRLSTLSVSPMISCIGERADSARRSHQRVCGPATTSYGRFRSRIPSCRVSCETRNAN
jgi:hypothetical protein